MSNLRRRFLLVSPNELTDREEAENCNWARARLAQSHGICKSEVVTAGEIIDLPNGMRLYELPARPTGPRAAPDDNASRLRRLVKRAVKEAFAEMGVEVASDGVTGRSGETPASC